RANDDLVRVADVNCTATGECSDIEILSLLAKDDDQPAVNPPEAAKQPDPKIRTLGGMRLSLRYTPPTLGGLEVKKVIWTIGYKGRYCTRYGIDATGCITRE